MSGVKFGGRKWVRGLCVQKWPRRSDHPRPQYRSQTFTHSRRQSPIIIRRVENPPVISDLQINFNQYSSNRPLDRHPPRILRNFFGLTTDTRRDPRRIPKKGLEAIHRPPRGHSIADDQTFTRLIAGKLVLLLDGYPDGISTSVEQRRLEQPSSLARVAETLCAQVEVPLGTSKSELITRRRSVSRSSINRGLRRRGVAVLDRLKRMDTRG